MNRCYRSTTGMFSISALAVTNLFVVLLPCLLVLHLTLQRWRHRRSSAAMSHSDVFTLHMVAIELIHSLGLVLVLCAVSSDLPLMLNVSVLLVSVNFNAQISFHTLTCVERYLAVVHPVTYRNLGKEKGIQIRNISTGCAWLLSIMGTTLMIIDNLKLMNAMVLCFFSLILIVVSYCSLSVLCVLIRPGPGDGGVARRRVDQSKLRAFYTITAILGALLVRFGGNILSSSLYNLPLLEDSERCGILTSTCWVGLPSGLVLPLLFLHRAGKLPCC
ncbi:uncharacterized protein V6R79_025490 [Siganus canaliculatus]